MVVVVVVVMGIGDWRLKSLIQLYNLDSPTWHQQRKKERKKEFKFGLDWIGLM